MGHAHLPGLATRGLERFSVAFPPCSRSILDSRTVLEEDPPLSIGRHGLSFLKSPKIHRVGMWEEVMHATRDVEEKGIKNNLNSNSPML